MTTLTQIGSTVSQLEGCLATGGAIVREADGDFAIEGGTSRPLSRMPTLRFRPQSTLAKRNFS
jgi:hypothetical protein